MEKELKNIQITEDKNSLDEDKPKTKGKLKRIVWGCGIILVVGIGIVWKCWDGQRIDLKKLSMDELNELRDKLHEKVLSPDTDQEYKIECMKWRSVVDNIISDRNPVNCEDYVYPKGGDHGNNLWKPD